MDIATQTHLSTLRLALEYRLNTLRAEVHAAQLARRQARDVNEISDTKDCAEAQQHLELDEAQEQHDIEELTDTEAALQRLATGTYGDCTDCGEPIGLARLQLMPAAPRCAACQQRKEQAQPGQHR